MITAQELAKYIISTIKKQMTDIQPEEFDVTPLKLQKLLYYCQGYSLALTGKPAFSDPIEAWKFGPVVDSVYQEYKKYEGGIIPYAEIEAETIPDETLQSIVDLVLADKGQYSGGALARMTHKESPWRNSYQGAYGGVYMNAKISNEALKDYFASELLKREEDYEDEDVFWNTIGTKVSRERMEAAIAELGKLLAPCKNTFAVIEQIKYIEDLERQGIIERPIPQTAYKYPTDILPNVF